MFCNSHTFLKVNLLVMLLVFASKLIPMYFYYFILNLINLSC